MSTTTQPGKGDKASSSRRSVAIPVPQMRTGDAYETWKNDVLKWCRYTDMEPSVRGLAIHFALTSRAKAISDQIPIDDLGSDDGVRTLLAKLDSIFLPGKPQRQFLAYRRMHKLSRASTMSMVDFICEFEEIYFNHKRQGLDLPDPVVGYMLLSACNLSEDKVQLVMSGLSEDLSYKDMKATILRVFGHGLELGAEADGPLSSGIFYASGSRSTRRGKRGGGLRSRSHWGTSRNQGGSGMNFDSLPYRKKNLRGRDGQIMSCTVCCSIYHWVKDCGNKLGGWKNPEGRDGRITACAVCRSIYHWAKDCPDAPNNQDRGNASASSDLGGSYKVHFTM